MTHPLFRHWFGLVDEALLLTTFDGRLVEVNAAAIALLKRPRRELLASRLGDLVVDPAPRLSDFLSLSSRSKQYIPGSLTLRVALADVPCRCDGALSEAESPDAAEPLLLIRLREKRTAFTEFELLNRDQHIERLAYEIEQRKLANAALYHERERFRVTFSSIGDGVIATDAAGHITFMNASAEQLTGWPVTEAVHAHLREVFTIVNEDTRVPVTNPILRSLQTGTVVGLANHTILIDRAGTERAIDDSAAPIRSESGEILGAVLVFRDVSEKRASDKALAASHDLLEARVLERTASLEQSNRALLAHQTKLLAANAELSQFAYVAAHDLQEPMRMIVSYLELITRRCGSLFDEKAQDYFTIASTNAKRMQLMIKSVLDYGTIGMDGRAPARVEVADCLREAIESLRAPIEQSGAIIEHTSLPSVTGHSAQLTRVFQNLLSNALTFRGPEAPRIRVRAIREPSRWVVRVADNGIGIKPHEGGRLFQLFQRIHGSDRYPGVGIGLATCKKIIEQHGGTMWFESTGVGGTEFSFTLPQDSET